MRYKCRRVEENFKTHPITIKREPLIDKHTKVFAMGSCFALEIAKYLNKKNYNILTPKSELNDVVDHRLIWYNTYSILYEFERIVGIFKQNNDDIWKTSSGQYQDPYRRCVFSNTKKGLLNLINDLNKRIKECIISSEVLIITLGLVEAWAKSDDNRKICASPGSCSSKGGVVKIVLLSLFLMKTI